MKQNDTAEPGSSPFAWSVRMLDLLLRHRVVAIAVTAGIVLHLAIGLLGWQGFPCPVHATTGLRCPGCGLSEAAVALFHGQLAEAIRYHPFVVPLLAGGAILAVSVILPARGRDRLRRVLIEVERGTHVCAIVLMSLFLYGLARLTVDAALAFVS